MSMLTSRCPGADKGAAKKATSIQRQVVVHSEVSSLCLILQVTVMKTTRDNMSFIGDSISK